MAEIDLVSQLRREASRATVTDDGDECCCAPNWTCCNPQLLADSADAIATLSAQLAEARAERDMNAAALKCYAIEQARLLKELADARAERRGVTDEMVRAALRVYGATPITDLDWMRKVLTAAQSAALLVGEKP